MQRRWENGSLAPLTPKRPDMHELDDDDLGRLRRLIAGKPDMTLAGLAGALGNDASVPTALNFIRHCGYAATAE